MKISLTSLIVDDQAKAHTFYTEVMGFVTKHNIPMGKDRWLTLVSPEAPDGVELVLEPNDNPMLNGLAETYQRGLFDHGIPATAFLVSDIQAEYERMLALGVTFTLAPTPAGPVTIARFEDTCGNLIQIYQT